jgi:hypothetical protein
LDARVITTVVTPATSIDLTKVEKLVSDLSLDENYDGAFLKRAITAASREVSRYCRRTFVVETVRDDIFMRSCGETLLLSRFPVKEITSLSEDGSALTADDDYKVDPETGMIFRATSSGRLTDWPAENISVTYQAGYSIIPEDLEKAVLRIAAQSYANRKRDPSLRSIKIPDVYEASFWVDGNGRSSMPADIQDIVEAYRVARI